jgi:phosphonoacetate hydrolase
MNDPQFLRSPTILAGMYEAGFKVAAVTAKDKLRTLLSHGLDYSDGRAFAFSAEKADQATMKDNGIDGVLNFVGLPLPEVYSADLSEFVFAAGVKLVEQHRPDLMYLSTTDYVQHKAAPGSKIANSFYAMIDRYLAELDALGCNVVATADHGMNDKYTPDGKPDVLYLQDLFDEWVGKGHARVILPITDPYVAHHGSLGSFATIYTPAGRNVGELIKRLQGIPGIELALSRNAACNRFELPTDRVGDIVVISTRHKVLGTSRARHDLSGLTEPLRSHGGITEERVPLIANRRIVLPPGHVLRNFDVFDVALNRIQ